MPFSRATSSILRVFLLIDGVDKRGGVDDIADAPRLDVADEMPVGIGERLRLGNDLVGSVLAEVPRTCSVRLPHALDADRLGDRDESHLFGVPPRKGALLRKFLFDLFITLGYSHCHKLLTLNGKQVHHGDRIRRPTHDTRRTCRARTSCRRAQTQSARAKDPLIRNRG